MLAARSSGAAALGRQRPGSGVRPLVGSRPRRLAGVVRAAAGPQQQRQQQSAAAAAAPAPTPAPDAQQAAAQQAPEAFAEAQQPYPVYTQQPGQYYTAPPALPPPPLYPAAYGPPPTAAAPGVPWWVWMGAGIVVAKVADFVQNLMKKGPQAMMTEMAMKQMMKGMNMPPPGTAGASPFGAAGAPPFGPYGAANPFAPNFKPPVDTTATTVDSSKPAAAASDSSRGEKFAARATGTAAAPAAAAAGAATAAAAAGAGPEEEAPKAAAANGMPVVEAAEVKEPASSSGSAGASTSGAGFFTDVGGAGAAGGAGAGADGGADVGQMTAMMEQMLRDPNMQKMLYPYLPEPMRNPQSIEWMLSTPEVRKQLEQTLASSGMSMSPQMMQMMKQMDFSQEKVQQQFSELGLKPEDVISKVLENPELASGFANPKVQAAIFDISQNPMNVMKYQEDPEIMKVLEKVTELFSPQMQGQK